MKNRFYYVLFLVYVIVVAFVLYVNGVFTGDEASLMNLTINVGFRNQLWKTELYHGRAGGADLSASEGVQGGGRQKPLGKLSGPQ